jgi:hypothetical protein
VSGLVHQRGDDRGIDAPRHCNDHATPSLGSRIGGGSARGSGRHVFKHVRAHQRCVGQGLCQPKWAEILPCCSATDGGTLGPERAEVQAATVPRLARASCVNLNDAQGNADRLVYVTFTQRLRPVLIVLGYN